MVSIIGGPGEQVAVTREADASASLGKARHREMWQHTYIWATQVDGVLYVLYLLEYYCHCRWT